MVISIKKPKPRLLNGVAYRFIVGNYPAENLKQGLRLGFLHNCVLYALLFIYSNPLKNKHLIIKSLLLHYYVFVFGALPRTPLPFWCPKRKRKRQVRLRRYLFFFWIAIILNSAVITGSGRRYFSAKAGPQAAEPTPAIILSMQITLLPHFSNSKL